MKTAHGFKISMLENELPPIPKRNDKKTILIANNYGRHANYGSMR